MIFLYTISPVVLLLSLMAILKPEEPILSDISQFIVTSINFLITTGQARYLMDLEEAAKKTIEKFTCLPAEKKKDAQKNLKRHEINWYIFLPAWWYLTYASILGVIRIILFAGYFAESWKGFFIWVDVAILTLMFLGYSFLAIVAFRSWRLKEVRGKAFPS